MNRNARLTDVGTGHCGRLNRCNHFTDFGECRRSDKVKHFFAAVLTLALIAAPVIAAAKLF